MSYAVARLDDVHRRLIAGAVQDAFDKVDLYKEESGYVDLEGLDFPQLLIGDALREYNALAHGKAEALMGKEHIMYFGFDVHEGKFQFVRED